MQGRSRSIHLSVHIHKDPAAMAERAAHILAAACEEAVAERGVFKIALSGGQTPIPLFRLLVASDALLPQARRSGPGGGRRQV